MMRSTMTVGRAVLSSGRTYCQTNRFLFNQSSLQYYQTSSFILLTTARRLLISNASNYMKQNGLNYMKQNGLIRPFIRRRCATGPQGSSGPGSSAAPEQKLSLFQKFKKMWKDYWYVMIPVHVVTSTGWFGAFYHVSASGVDLGHYLRKVGVSENVVKHITESKMGHIAVAWALYKVATPARYAVTLGGTTLSINVLRNMGYIKPANVLMAKGRKQIQSLKDKQFPKD